MMNAHRAGDYAATTILADEIQKMKAGGGVEAQLAGSFARPVEAPSAAGAFFREAGRSIGPGLAGFGAGAASGAAVGAGAAGSGPQA